MPQIITVMTLLSATVALVILTSGLAYGQPNDGFQSSFLEGVIDGCIDARKKKIDQRQIPFESKSVVRGYCKCMAPTIASFINPEAQVDSPSKEKEFSDRYLRISSTCLQKSKDQSRTLSVKAEAFGVIAGTFSSGLSMAEFCSDREGLRLDAEGSIRLYLTQNNKVFDQVKEAITIIVTNQEGPAEAKKLMEQLLPSAATDAVEYVKRMNPSKDQCVIALGRLRKGYWDINIRNSKEVKLILGE